MRWLKWVIIGGLVLVVALISAVYFILSSYDFNDLKPQIAQAARRPQDGNLPLGETYGSRWDSAHH